MVQTEVNAARYGKMQEDTVKYNQCSPLQQMLQNAVKCSKVQQTQQNAVEYIETH
jgi:hypothetical protein